MVQPMKYRDVAKAMRKQDCTSKPGKGDHEKWYCPCGKHMVPITKPGTVSAGVVRDAIKKLECLPEGWLQ